MIYIDGTLLGDNVGRPIAQAIPTLLLSVPYQTMMANSTANSVECVVWVWFLKDCWIGFCIIEIVFDFFEKENNCKSKSTRHLLDLFFSVGHSFYRQREMRRNMALNSGLPLFEIQSTLSYIIWFI